MPNLFISHASKDKPFVRKLATALLSEGFPVWLDSWSLTLGDSLLDKIYEGIEKSSMVILVISQHAIESGWVNRELNAALEKEKQAGRKFVIPIKIDSCDAPLKIADRLYADFSSSFGASLIRLSDYLASQGCKELVVNPERELISLSFTREVNLDVHSLWKTTGYIQHRHENATIKGAQIVINDDQECELLLDKLHNRIDFMADDEFYSRQLEEMLRDVLSQIRDSYRYLSDGVALMLNKNCPRDAIFWFAKLIRARIVYRLWTVQKPNASDNLIYGKTWRCANLSSESSASEFFSTEDVEIVDLSRDPYFADGHNFHLWIGKEAAKGLRNSDGVYESPSRFSDACNYDAEVKYVLPQMVLSYLERGGRGGDIIWKLDEAFVGIA
jgi:TIR domain